MDNYVSKGPKPQFNVTLFNYITCITINKKMAGDFLVFIKSSPSFFEDFSDFYDDLSVVLNEQRDLIVSEKDDYQISKYRNVITINMESECAVTMAEFILNEAKMCCDSVQFLSLGSFVAFGRRLRDAGHCNINATLNPNRGPVREIVIRKEIIR